MIVAYITGDREGLLSVFSDPDKFYAAAPYTFLIASLLVLIFDRESSAWILSWLSDSTPPAPCSDVSPRE
jgi:hypothetical protein